MRVPPFHTVTRVVGTLTAAGLSPAVGGSGLLVALGLADEARDWDVTVDAPDDVVRTALAMTELRYQDRTERSGIYATETRYVIDGGDHEVDLLVGFAARTPDGVERLPVRVTGKWRGLPLADPAVWARAYRLIGRPASAELLEQWLAAHPS